MRTTIRSEIVESENDVGIKSFPSFNSSKNAYAVDRLLRRKVKFHYKIYYTYIRYMLWKKCLYRRITQSDSCNNTQ